VREYKTRFQHGQLLQVEEGAGCRFVFVRQVSSFPEEQPNEAAPFPRCRRGKPDLSATGTGKRGSMDTEDMTFTALHVLYGRLQTLRSLELLEVIDANFSTYYQDILEEAYAALAQVETEIDQLNAELEYHHQRFQEARDQQSQEQNP
jgi:hypothetical protein